MKKLISLLLALMLLCGAVAFAEEAAPEEIDYGPKIGVTLYTMRETYKAYRQEALDAGKTEAEASTYAMRTLLPQLAAMGYKGYQPNWQDPDWWLMDASELKALNEELGLTLISPHWFTAWEYSEEDIKKTLDYLIEAGATGISYDVNSPEYTGKGKIITQQMMTKWVDATSDKIKFMQDKIEEYGYSDKLRVGFHTHSMEWIPVASYGNRYYVDILFDRFGMDVDLHFDTSHAVYPNVGYAGIYPEEDILGEWGLEKYVWQHGDQYNMIHLKDVDIEGQHTTAIGQGDIEWTEVLEGIAYHDNIEWILVEDNHPPKHNRTELESVQTSMNYLVEMYKTLGIPMAE